MIQKTLSTIKHILALLKFKKVIGDKVLGIFLDSVKTYSLVLIKEKTETFDINNLQYLSRGSIIWAEFGFNAGHEFGGRHPALVLKFINNGEDIYVVPLDVGELPKGKRKENGEPKDGFIEIPMSDDNGKIVCKMQKMDRWCDVRRLRCISWLLVDFSSVGAYMRRDYVDKIENETTKYNFTPLRKRVLTKS